MFKTMTLTVSLTPFTKKDTKTESLSFLLFKVTG